MSTTFAQLWEELRRADRVEEWAQVLSRALTKRFGQDTVEKAVYIGAALGALVLLYVMFDIYRMLRTPPDVARRMHGAAADATTKPPPKPAGKKGKKRPDAEPEPVPEAAPAEAAPAVALLPQCKRTRTPTLDTCAVIKGFPQCGVMGTTADGWILFASSREKRKAFAYTLHPQLLTTAKTNVNFVQLTDVGHDAVVTGIATNACGSYVALVDPVNNRLYCYRNTTREEDGPHGPDVKTAGVQYVRTVALAKGVSIEGYTHLALTDNGACLMCFQCKEGVVDFIDMATGARLGTEKVKLGNTAQWGHAEGNRVCASGSYMHECRLFELTAHTTLQKIATVPNTDKAAKVAMSADGTRLVMQLAGDAGDIHVWDLDVDLKREEVPRLMCKFADPAFVDADAMTLSYVQRTSGSRRRDLEVLLRRGGDLVVHRVEHAQDPGRQRYAGVVCEVHDAHDGEAVRHAALCTRSGCVATTCENDARNAVRLWPVASPGK